MDNVTIAFWMFSAAVLVHLLFCAVLYKDIKGRAQNGKHYSRDVIDIAKEKGLFGYILAGSYYLMIILFITIVGVTSLK
jgi:hypothetical protein